MDNRFLLTLEQPEARYEQHGQVGPTQTIATPPKRGQLKPSFSATPLTAQTVAVLRVWLREHTGNPDEPLFPTRRGNPLSSDAVAWLTAKHATAATERCPSMVNKHVTPHVLRHTAAMQLLQAGVDVSVIALWLGHENIQTTQIYLHADLALKERALARTTPANTTPGRYRPADPLLAFLEAL